MDNIISGPDHPRWTAPQFVALAQHKQEAAMPNLSEAAKMADEALQNLISLAIPHFSDEVQALAIKLAQEAQIALRVAHVPPFDKSTIPEGYMLVPIVLPPGIVTQATPAVELRDKPGNMVERTWRLLISALQAGGGVLSHAAPLHHPRRRPVVCRHHRADLPAALDRVRALRAGCTGGWLRRPGRHHGHGHALAQDREAGVAAMTDPFTDEDVGKAIAAANAHTDARIHSREDRYRAALLAGTERLRAQGTWNEAIEAAAKVSQNSGFVSSHRIARAIRALKRPEAP